MPRAPRSDPPANCSRCPRLVDFRRENKKRFPNYFNAPTPSLGARDAALLIVGLAPGLHGANRTGLAFTGDASGALLFRTLAAFGFANQTDPTKNGEDVRLTNTAITNAVRCVPPQNKPVAAEIKACRPFLVQQIRSMPKLRAILCLGKVAHDSLLAALEIKAKDAPFRHGARHTAPQHNLSVFDSYHCSRYNTNTGRLTPEMFDAVFAEIAAEIS